MTRKHKYARNTRTGLFFVHGKGFVSDMSCATGLDAVELAAVRYAFANVEPVAKYSAEYFVACFVAVLGSEPSEKRVARFEAIAARVRRGGFNFSGSQIS